MKLLAVIIMGLIFLSPLTVMSEETEDCERYYELSKQYVSKPADRNQNYVPTTAQATTSIAYSRIYLNCKVWQEQLKGENE